MGEKTFNWWKYHRWVFFNRIKLLKFLSVFFVFQNGVFIVYRLNFNNVCRIKIDHIRERNNIKVTSAIRPSHII